MRLIQTIRLPAHHIAVMPVKVDENESTLLLKQNFRLVDLLCIEDSVLEANQEGRAMVVVSNSSKISHVLKSGEEIGTVCKVSVVNSVNMNVNSHLHTVCFIGLGHAELILYLVKTMAHLMLYLPSCLYDELILNGNNEILTIDEQVEEERFSH